MSKTSIEWTEMTWNPIVGCSIVSPGCTNCYAMKMAARIEAMGNQPRYAGTTKKVKGNAVWTGKLAQAPDSVLTAPLRRKKPTTYFVNSMGDLFHEDCPDEWIDKVFAVMAMSPQHTFQVLTKRAGRMRDYFSEPRWDISADYTMDNILGNDFPIDGNNLAMRIWEGPLPNVWLGVSTERQQEADERIPLLLQTPAAVRFISAEPLLGPIDLERDHNLSGRKFNSLGDDITPGLVPGSNAKLDWVIVGGESGPGARPMHPAWARDLREQCAAQDIPYFFKQWGAFIPESCAARDHQGAHTSQTFGKSCVKSDGETFWSVGKTKAGRLLDGALHDAMPERCA